MEEHNQLAVFQLGIYSDSSFEYTSVPISQSDQVIAEQNLSDSARFPEHIFCRGIRYAARKGGSTAEGSQYREPETSFLQSSQQGSASVVSEVQGAHALPIPSVTRTEAFEEQKYQSSSPIQEADLEWDNWQPSNEPFTLDSHHADLAKQLAERREYANFAKRLAKSEKESEHRLSSIFPGYKTTNPIPIPKTSQTYKQSQNMDLGPNEEDLLAEPLIEPLAGPQLEVKPHPGPLHNPIISHDSADNRKDKPGVPMPQGNIKTHTETGTKNKTSTTPAAWRIVAPNSTAQQTAQNHGTPLWEYGYAGMSEIYYSSLDHIFHGTPYHIPDTVPSAPPYIMTAHEQYFVDGF